MTFAFGGQLFDTEALEARRHNSPPDLPRRIPRGGAFHLETPAELLSSLEAILVIFSKRPLKSLNNQSDFDSAIRRFDPFRATQHLSC
ncbi:hypothetical protein KIP88_33545 [Bradyrhizobium sp. SRL28]|uniref:hypothetical protein n=1 Tax=Bradyrhizobium sp. SRL28 TaxID=2836178 RepID=UPI001BDEF9D1|nr:hypothetical protein [Bradyrhizobium sp. SRL28]MBT1515411.1 hypothetical protein [Bradyrhizobium sp. SRL28]